MDLLAGFGTLAGIGACAVPVSGCLKLLGSLRGVQSQLQLSHHQGLKTLVGTDTGAVVQIILGSGPEGYRQLLEICSE